MSIFRIMTRNMLVLLMWVVLTGVWASQGGADVFTAGDCIRGNGVLKSEVRTLDPFFALDVDGAFMVNIHCGKKQTISVSADANILSLISTDVRNGRLFVSTRKPICTSQTLIIDIAVENIASVTSGGANDIRIADLHNLSLEVILGGAGDLHAYGHTGDLSASILGASNIRALDLQAERVTVSISGAGDAEVYASRSLRAVISGAGDVRYAGEPESVDKQVTGWGEIAPLAE